MRWGPLVLTVLLACGGGGGGETSIVADPHEINDDVGTCAPMALDFHAGDLTLHVPGDEDFFCFTLADDSWILVHATTEVQILDAAGTPLIDSLPQQGAHAISEVLLAGPYVLRAYSSLSQVRYYLLDVQTQAIILDPPPDPREGAGDNVFCGPDLGDIRANPSLIVGLTIHDSTDVDHSCFTLQVPLTVDVGITFPHSLGNLDLEVLDTGLAVIGSSTTLDDDEAIQMPLPAGTYSIRVFSPTGETNRYDLAARAQ